MSVRMYVTKRDILQCDQKRMIYRIRENVAEQMEINAGELPKGDCSQNNVREV